MAKKIEKPVWKKLLTTVSVLVILGFFSLFMLTFVALIFGGDVTPSGNIALVKVTGPIMAEQSTGAFATSVASSTEIVSLLDKAEKNDEVKAVILEINSPGGSAVASSEIANKVKSLNKTTVAVIREVGASGGYWIASSADKIYAHELSVTGSIGVIASYIEIGGLLDRYNMSYRRLVAGDYKDAGSPLKKMTPEEEELFNSLLSKMHTAFINEVASNREMSVEEVTSLANGFVYLGSEAKDNGLIDSLGGRDDAVAYIEETLGVKGEVAEYKGKRTLGDLLTEVQFVRGYSVGKGIGDSLKAEGEFKVRV